MIRLLKYSFVILILCVSMSSCSPGSSVSKSALKKTSSLWDGSDPHPWNGDWVAIWTGSLFRAMSMDAPVFTIQDDGSFSFELPNYRDIYTCLEDMGDNTFMYQRIKWRAVGNLKKLEYAKFKLFHLSNDPEMLCDQIWRSEYASTIDQARHKEIMVPFASRESLAKFWTESKLEGMHVIYAGFKKLFMKIKHLVDFTRSRGAASGDQVDGFEDDNNFRWDDMDKYMSELELQLGRTVVTVDQEDVHYDTKL